MTEREINEKVRRACEHAATDALPRVLADCKEQASGAEMKPRAKRKRPFTRFAGIAACLCLLVGGLLGIRQYRVNRAVDATVSLDVNPAVELRVNRNERVLAVTPLNEDGEIIIGDLDFRGSDLQVAVNAMIGSMLQNGYLNELANSILISVDNPDTARGTAMQARLTEAVNRLLQTDGFSGAVLSQTVEQDDALRQLAETYGITEGKAQLIRDILRADTRHSFDELVPLSVNELHLLLRDETASAAHVEVIGSASEKAYIGKAEAERIALAHAGITADALSSRKTEMDTHKGIMIYDVEFTAGSFEYEYEINAATGEILKAEKEADRSPVESGKPAAVIGAEKAKAIAFAHAGVTADAVFACTCETDTDDGITVYELDFRCGDFEYEYEINAATGEILKAEKEADRAPVESGKPAAVIGAEKAKAIAFAHAGVTADAVFACTCETDTDDGITVYELDFRCGDFEYEYEINAATGEIRKAEKDRDD